MKVQDQNSRHNNTIMTIEEDDDVIKTIASANHGEQNDETPRSPSKKRGSLHWSPENNSVASHEEMSEKTTWNQIV
jgi:hypothetical protein